MNKNPIYISKNVVFGSSVLILLFSFSIVILFYNGFDPSWVIYVQMFACLMLSYATWNIVFAWSRDLNFYILKKYDYKADVESQLMADKLNSIANIPQLSTDDEVKRLINIIRWHKKVAYLPVWAFVITILMIMFMSPTSR